MGSSVNSTVVDLLEPLAIYTSFFGLMPWYSFRQNKLKYSKIFKCYTIFLAVVVTALSLSLTVARTEVIYPQILTIFALENFVLEITGLTLFLITILGSATWNMSIWEQLLKKMHEVEIKNDLCCDIKNRSTRNALLFSFALGNIYMGSLFILEFRCYGKYDNEVYYFISTLVFRYTEFITAFTILSIVTIIKQRYEATNWLCCKHGKVIRKNCIKTITAVEKLYTEMFQISQIFNKLFGWPLLWLCFYSELQVLGCLTFLIGPAKINQNALAYRWRVSIHMLYALQITVSMRA